MHFGRKCSAAIFRVSELVSLDAEVIQKKSVIIQDNLRQFGPSCPMSHNEKDQTPVTIQSFSHLPLVMYEKELQWKSPHLVDWDNSFSASALHNCEWPNYIKSP